MIDSAPKNITAYIGFCLLSVLVAVLTSLGAQLKGTAPIDVWVLMSSGIDALVAALTMMLLAMKLASVGHEPLSARASEHEDRLELDDPPAPLVTPRGAGQMPGITGSDGRG